MSERKISYAEREFTGLRNELIGYVQTYYPDLITNFGDAGLFSVLVDINAAVADNLNFHIDRSIQETYLQFAQQTNSIYNIARTYGLKIPGNRPSVAVCQFSINVPVDGDKEDVNYLGILKAGTKISGGGQSFETLSDIDFSSTINSNGYQNRLKLPIFDSNNKVVSYQIIKTEVVVNGETRTLRQIVNTNNVKPFYQIILPERNVLSISSIIVQDGTSITTIPEDSVFFDDNQRWFEVDALAQQKIYIEDSNLPVVDGIRQGKWTKTNKKFITEYTPENFMVITFGGSETDNDAITQFTLNEFNIDYNELTNNPVLGLTPKANTTIFVKYRVGGGQQSILNPNTLTRITSSNLVITGPNSTINTAVSNSLRVTNVTSSLGGANQPTIEEARNYIGFNFASQERCVTLEDYESQIFKMPGKFGAPSKVSVTKAGNKININILTTDVNGNLSSNINSNIANNISTYLSQYRMINDYVVVQPAQVVNIGFVLDIQYNKQYPPTDLSTSIVTNLSNIFDKSKLALGDDVFLGTVKNVIMNTPGVLNLTSLKVYNKVGGIYSQNTSVQTVASDGEIQITEEVILADDNQILQILNPSIDIVVRLK
jgi:hypothetical protein